MTVRMESQMASLKAGGRMARAAPLRTRSESKKVLRSTLIPRTPTRERAGREAVVVTPPPPSPVRDLPIPGGARPTKAPRYQGRVSAPINLVPILDSSSDWSSRLLAESSPFLLEDESFLDSPTANHMSPPFSRLRPILQRSSALTGLDHVTVAFLDRPF